MLETCKLKPDRVRKVKGKVDWARDFRARNAIPRVRPGFNFWMGCAGILTAMRGSCAVLICLLACGGCGPREKAAAPPEPAAGPPSRSAGLEQVVQAVNEPGAGAVLVNVWATWCAPCREEFPDLMRVHEEYREQGLRMVLVSADFEDQEADARRFLASQGVDFPSFIKTGDDMEFIEGMDRRWTGALPATFVYDGQGTLRHFQEGRTHYAALAPIVAAALSATDSLAKEATP